MAFVKHLPPVEMSVPGEQGTFVFRRLSADEVDQVKAALIKDTAAMFDAQAVATLNQLNDPNDEEVKKARALATAKQRDDPLNGLSEHKIVEFGLVGWKGEGYPDFSDDAKAELDPFTRRWAACQIAQLSMIQGENQSGEVDGSVLPSAQDGANSSRPRLVTSGQPS